jgi:hypothetical protein
MPDLPSVEEQRKRLELEVVVRQIQHTTTSNKLPSVEEALKLLLPSQDSVVQFWVFCG